MRLSRRAVLAGLAIASLIGPRARFSLVAAVLRQSLRAGAFQRAPQVRQFRQQVARIRVALRGARGDNDLSSRREDVRAR